MQILFSPQRFLRSTPWFQFFENLENTIPPLLIVGARINKDGITITADFTIRFNYRMEHETV